MLITNLAGFLSTIHPSATHARGQVSDWGAEIEYPPPNRAAIGCELCLLPILTAKPGALPIPGKPEEPFLQMRAADWPERNICAFTQLFKILQPPTVPNAAPGLFGWSFRRVFSLFDSHTEIFVSFMRPSIMRYRNI